MRSVVAALGMVALCSCSGSGTASRESAMASATPDSLAPLPDPLPEVVARVNGQPIPLRNVRIIAEQNLKGQGSAGQRPAAYRAAIEQLIARELLFQEAVVRGLGPDTEAIERAYDEARVPYKDDETWKLFLAQQGMNEEGFRAELRLQHTVQALLRQQLAKVPQATDQEAQAFYQANPALFDSGERLRASHIQIRVTESQTAEVRAALKQRAGTLLEQIRGGADFAELARKSSGDPGSAGRGGELPVFQKGEFHPAFEQVAYALKPGEVSEVVETPFGYHIIKLHERLPSVHADFETAKERVKADLLVRKHREAFQQLVGTLRARAKIETYL